MRYLLWKIRKLKEKDLQILMQAIEKRYAEAYPEWEVLYLALHKDPKLRQQELAQFQQFLQRNKKGFPSGEAVTCEERASD